MEHTPTPWKLINEKTIVGTDHPRQGYVADVNLHRSNDEQQPDGDTNAAHIVRCVNSHDDLLAVVKRVYEYEMERMEKDDHHFDEEEIRYWGELITQAEGK